MAMLKAAALANVLPTAAHTGTFCLSFANVSKGEREEMACSLFGYLHKGCQA